MIEAPRTDPTPIFELFRGAYATELLTAAVVHFDVFGQVAERPLSMDELGAQLGLAPRPANVLIVALRAMQLLQSDAGGRLAPSSVAREHLIAGGRFYVGDYLGLAADSPGVLAMVDRLRTNRPAGAHAEPSGTAFIFREGTPSAMEQEASARRLTLGLAGRAKNVAPVLAQRLELGDARTLLDLGGGTGIYSIALVQRFNGLRAIVFDRPEVLKVADEMRREHGVADRVELAAGDMFHDPLPERVDAVLLSNVLHDWDVPECRTLVERSSAALAPGGQVLVHDVFLNDELDGPLAVALYSASLFSLTEGRAYSGAEYRALLAAAGLEPGGIVPTLVHCGVLSGRKRG